MRFLSAALGATALAVCSGALPGQDLYELTSDGTPFIDAEKALRSIYGEPLSSVPQQAVSETIVDLAEGLPPGGAIDLPRSVPCGVLDLRRVADDVQITRGWGGMVVLGPGQAEPDESIGL